MKKIFPNPRAYTMKGGGVERSEFFEENMKKYEENMEEMRRNMKEL